MSTKTNTNTQNQYSAAGMQNYNGFQSQLGTGLSNMVNNPLGSSYFQNQLAMGQRTASQLGQRNMNNITSNTKASGGLLSGAGGYQSAMQNNAMLSNSAAQSGAFNSSLSSALNNRNFGLQAMEGYNPLQTGSNTQQSKSGLGTWLPQVAGMAIQGATGGLAGLAGAGTSAGYSAIQNAANTANNPWTTTTPTVNQGSTPQAWGY